MALRRGLIRQRAVGSQRQTDWGLGPGGTAGTALSTTGASVLGSGITTTTGKLTLVRTRGILSISLGLATSAQDGFFCALGMGLTTIQAFTDVGITALALPFDDMQWDGWFYHRMFDIRSGVVSSSSNPGPKDVVQIEIDSKAMRKIDGNGIFFAVLQFVESGTATANVHFNTRMLLKLG